MYQYPKDLIPLLKDRAQKMEKRKYMKPPQMPSDEELTILLETAFHASFLTEEGRRPGFRIIYMPPSSKKEDKDNSEKKRKRYFTFDYERDFTIAELNKIAPAADFTRLILCVYASKKRNKEISLKIWGLLDVGNNWWNFIRHESSSGMPPPNYFTITSSFPGELSISLQGEVIVNLKNGSISYPSISPIWDGPIDAFLEKARQKLYDDVIEELKTKAWDEEGHDNDYPKRLYNFFLERVLYNIRERAHGGTLLIIPSIVGKDDTRLTDRINIKYGALYDYAWEAIKKSLVTHRQYYDLHFPLWDGSRNLTKELFQKHSILESEIDRIEEIISDIAQGIASLSAVDGAVVMNDEFHVLGFGAEVIATSSTLKEVISKTSKGRDSRIPIESFGTRHRSAFRFCSSYEDSIAFVVSQDGGVKAIKREGKNVIYWPDINNGSMGI